MSDSTARSDSPLARLVSIPTSSEPLDGLFYEPEGGATAGAVLIMHGNCMNFYSGPARFLPKVLVEQGFACLAYNRRGHDILVTPLHRAASGGAYQLIDEAREDNRLASQWLANRGFGTPAVIGHSNGGMLAVQHVADHPDTPALVLLSAHKGGLGILPAISAAGLFAEDKLDERISTAEQMVAEGRGRDLLLLPNWWHVISAGSLIDYSSRLPEMLDVAPQVACPVLYIRGDQESAEIYPAEVFAERQGRTQVEIIENCNHFYAGRETAVTDLVAPWLRQTMSQP
ncbi:lysophospholipase [Aureimonas fodinaquatilis]|uniref:Lysophospholipase n=1 Tax=Aureimonas fodinaquatilis TaxID=2565783 RepID=A0A5B0DTB6_9HYPH|nr:alpha/beta fold hydrolase [Aureimonas fodinaquatilis]KAA0969011.1 lysophospholipase [Aureimonas fodinaquatilis]